MYICIPAGIYSHPPEALGHINLSGTLFNAIITSSRADEERRRYFNEFLEDTQYWSEKQKKNKKNSWEKKNTHTHHSTDPFPVHHHFRMAILIMLPGYIVSILRKETNRLLLVRVSLFAEYLFVYIYILYYTQ